MLSGEIVHKNYHYYYYYSNSNNSNHSNNNHIVMLCEMERVLPLYDDIFVEYQ